VAHRNGAGLATDTTVNEARKIVGTAKRDERSSRLGSAKKQITVAVYDGTERVGEIAERDDGAGFDAFDLTGKHIGTFETRLAAMRSIPSTGGARS
jgi:hypothetical protein